MTATAHRERQIVGLARAAALAIAVLAVTGWLPGSTWLPLAAALAVGLPHGAVDHVVLARRLGGWRGQAVGTVGYAAAAVAVFALTVLAPLTTWTAFLIVSVWHFGTADRDALEATAVRPGLLHTLAAGLIPVGGLLVRGADELRPLAERLDPSVVRLLAPEVVSATTTVLCVVVLAALAAEWAAGRRRSVADLAALSLLFVTAPPLWAFGIYFAAWHAPRHITRMLVSEDPWRRTTAVEGLAAGARRWTRDAALPTALAVAAGLVLLRLSATTDPVEITTAALRVTAAVTFPHAATVAFLDRRGRRDARRDGQGPRSASRSSHAGAVTVSSAIRVTKTVDAGPRAVGGSRPHAH